MPPKKGQKKGKKGNQDDDEYWASLASKLDPKPASPSPVSTPAAEEEEEEEEVAALRPKITSFASLGYEGLDEGMSDEDDGGGLMAQISKASGGKKDKKKKKSTVQEEEVDALNDAHVDLASPRGAVEVGADDWMEEEFGSTKDKKGKKGKGKKGGKQQQAKDESDDEVEAVLKAVETVKLDDESSPAPAETEPADDDEEDGTGPTKVLSKKEKEKLKKEKEKAKKKAQAAAKKAAGPTTAEDVPPPTPALATIETTESAPPATEGADDDGDDDEGGLDAAGKKKKKKKKPAAKKEEKPAPPKKESAQMAALRKALEARQAAEAEAARKEQEERDRIEAEEKRLEEEERQKAEEKARKKEKEKAKKEQLKKEGKLLTPKQKAEKAAAEIRRQALLGQQGLSIAGLSASPDDAPRKVSYSKKKPPTKKDEPVLKAEEPTPVEEPAVAEPREVLEAKSVVEEDDDVKDDWDVESEKETVDAKAAVKDDWDASESEEEKPAPPPDKAAAAPAKGVAHNGKSNGKAASIISKTHPAIKPSAPSKASPTTKAPPAKGPPPKSPASKPATGKGKAVEVEESSEEESEEDDDDSEDDSDDESDDSESEDENGMTATERQAAERKAAAKARRLAKNEEALKARSKDNMRSPICVILGHVDTGKTKLLDKIRQTNVQEGEAGGITQQIGATYFPMDAIRSKTAVLAEADLKEYKLPGLLVIDTPGHESFTNLRTRGSSLCNIAILVVDIMHGLEPQTLESIRLLRDGKTPFIVALNKIDRLYGWKAIPDGGFQASLAAQDISVQREYKDRLQKTILAFAEQGLNSLPYYENKDFARVVSLVPTSAHTGEGIPDMLMLIIKLTQERMTERLMYLSTLECTVLEVKVIEGLGTTIDVVLSNGVLREGDKIVICGLNGAITTQVRALLTPQPMKELRIRGQYVHHKEVKASLGIKIVAPDLEKAIAGSRLLVVTDDDDEDELREEVMSDLTNLMNSVDKSGRGVCVQASTLGSLEALLEFLRTSKIPVSGINIGPVHRKDVMRCATMLEKAKELAVILAFDVPVDKEAERVADELGIKIFKADIIYHLFDAFTAYNAQIVEAKRVDSAPRAVWPCKLKIIACFAKRDPIIVGCDIIEGTLRVGTPICVIKTDPETKKKDIISLGRVTSMEINHKVKEVIKKSEAGGGVAVKIEHAAYESAKLYGRHFDDKDELVSMISRQSIDVLKEHFRNDVSKDDWLLIKQLKVKLDIP